MLPDSDSIVFFSLLGSGHVNPTLPLVRRLVAEGFDVTYFGYPARRPEIEAAGATFHNYGDDEFEVARYHPDGTFPTQLAPAAAGLLPYLIEVVRPLAPRLIVSDVMAVWGIALGQVLDVPVIGSVTTFAWPPEQIAEIDPLLATVDPVNRRAIDTLRDEHGVQLDERTPGIQYAEHNLVYTAESFNPPLGALAQNFAFIGPMLTARSGTPSGAPLFSDDQREKIFISMGSVLGSVLQLEWPFYRPFVEAFAGRDDVEVVLSVGRHLDPSAWELPAHVSAHSFVGQLEVLERADLFISHGGMNSVNEAMAAGVPMLLLPFWGDQPANARQVVAAGAGELLRSPPRPSPFSPHEVDAQVLAEAADAMLGDRRYSRAARAVGRALRDAPGLDRALEEVHRLIAR